MGVTFRRVHSPRLMEISYPQDTDTLYEDWRRNECFLVAHEAGAVLAYLDMIVQKKEWQGWINHLIVGQSHRQQGIGTMLLKAAQRWARGSELNAITVALQSKNEPAIQFFSKQGYSFRGFVDHYYGDGDVRFIYTRFLARSA